jgi:hypothetical protein
MEVHVRKQHAARERRERLLLAALLILGLAAFVGIPFYIGSRNPPANRPDLSQQMFLVFALLPGLIGLGNYAVSQRLQRAFRRPLNEALAEKCSETSVSGNGDTQADTGTTVDTEASIAACRPTLSETLAASAMLTGAFLVLTIVSVRGSGTPANSGLIYSGYGAYISTLWYLLARLNASALSPRFLVNSAVKASIAMLIGCAVGHELFAGASAAGMPANMFCFLIGLFHPLAMKSLKKTAIKTFGAQVVVEADLPVLLIEGIDDEAADLLEELGIASVQHLATANVPELAERSLYPQERILNWVDQAILAVHTGGRIRELRSAGIHSATEILALAALRKGDDTELAAVAKKRLEDAGERAGFSSGSTLLLVECIARDPALYVFRKATQYEARLGSHPDQSRSDRRADADVREKKAVVNPDEADYATPPNISLL